MRRLRENVVLNTEIGKTGEVIVEGHAIGRLDGFTFAPDAAEAGSDAKALQAAAQQVLAREIDARAEKLGSAPDDQFVLTSDGTIRWTGDAVAKLVAADDALHPRIRIIADERLTGASREKVQARLDLWLKTHVEKLLGPLFELSKAEDITGIGRGIAFQLVEALGVLERAKISAEMKDLDQPSRAALRKYGVRFGAYHIYFPGLLKPAARSLASLLWALKHDNVDLQAVSGAQHMASSGRTSFPVDKSLPRDAYRVLGYRQCGERAVRVDILERLADLIRPALGWRENSQGEKPAGAFDGRGFVVTQAMTSLTGSAGEDFASILRALGYRMERRPPLPPKETVKPAVVSEPAASETPAVEGATEAAAPAEASIEHAMSGDPAPSAGLLPTVWPISAASEEPVEAEADAAVPEEAAAEEAAPVEAVAEATHEEAAAPEAAADLAATSEAEPAEALVAEVLVADAAPATEAPAADAAPAVDAAAPAADAEPQLVEVWRPGGRMDDRKPRHRHHQHQRPHDRKPGEQAAAGEGGDGDKRERPRHHGRRDFRKRDEQAPAQAAEGAPAREGREERDRTRERFGKDRDRDNKRDNKPKFGDREHGGRDRDRDRGGRDRDKGGRDKREHGPAHRPYASSAPRERERAIDPNSPFAKLAALKEQLAANRKD
jgi:ATP-dependent RNA helicase SUPV3L1/SUV3